MVETITPAVSPALAHIIERPRLIPRLEEGGGSRVSMFAAPAGYGKTTLARQWGERQDCPVVWYRTNRASGDVALLAVQFDELFAAPAPRARSQRSRPRIRARARWAALSSASSRGSRRTSSSSSTSGRRLSLPS